jgi:hypothetical protein
MRRQLDNTIGFRASMAVTVETILFAVSLIIGLSDRSSLGPVMGYVVCIFLAASIVVMMACLYSRTSGERKILGLLALAAAILYAPFCIANYFLQLSVVAANPLNYPAEVLKLIAFVPGSATFALDMLGYGFLCLSTLAAAFSLPDPRDKALRIFCLIHGAIALPTFGAPIISSVFRSTSGQANDIGSWILLIWCALFTPIAILFARMFRR